MTARQTTEAAAAVAYALHTGCSAAVAAKQFHLHVSTVTRGIARANASRPVGRPASLEKLEQKQLDLLGATASLECDKGPFTQTLMRVTFYRAPTGVRLIPTSGRSGTELRSGIVTVSQGEFDARPHAADVEAAWALGLCGWAPSEA